MLERSTIQKEGIDPNAVLNLVNCLDSNGAHSYVLLRHGKLVSDGYWTPYRSDLFHNMFSVTKSFTSTAIGFAVQEGLVKTDDLVTKFFPEKLSNPPCDYMKQMTIKNLLTMATGHGEDYKLLWSAYILDEKDLHKDEDDVYNFLSSYVSKEPGSEFNYNNGATFMLGAILKKVSGLNLLDYLKPRFLDPLEIEARADSNKEGLNLAAAGFQLRTEDFAKFGQFYLNKGKWNGVQLLSADWIEEATARQIETISDAKEWGSGYCYQFWRLSDGHSYRADGLHGQLCIVAPHIDVVVALTSGTLDAGRTLEAVRELFATIENGSGSTSSDTESSSKLEAKLKTLQLALPEGDSLKASHNIPTTKYKLSENGFGFTAFQIESHTLKFWKGKDTETPFVTAKIGNKEWAITKNKENPYGFSLLLGELGVSGAWAEDKLVVDIIAAETVGGYCFEFSFMPHHAEVTVRRTPDKTPEFTLLAVEENDI